MMRIVQVKCYSGHTYAERPKSFLWQGIEYEVQKIEKAWREPDKRLFKVITDKGKTFELCYNETEDRWSLRAERSNPRKRKNK